MTDKMSMWVDENLSRRGFLGRTGKVVGALGFAMLGGLANPGHSSATILIDGCCDGTHCPLCSATPGVCATGYTYTGYTWQCCYGTNIMYCWDCAHHDPLGDTKCFCNSVSGVQC
jgi:hypothetical protein